MGINQSNPTCEVNQCLNQVKGVSANNGFGQYLVCVQSYSSAVRETTWVTVLASNTYTSTITATVSTPDTSVLVEISTSTDTVYETLTSYSQVLETVTEYTSTSVATSFATVTAQATTITAQPAKLKKKRGGCKPTSITLSSSSESSSVVSSESSAVPSSATPLSAASSSVVSSESSTITSETSAAPSSPAVSSESFVAPSSAVTSETSAAPSSSAVSSESSALPSSAAPSSSVVVSSAEPSSAPSSTVASESSIITSESSAPAISATPTHTTGPVSMASDCPSVEAYSSACSCIYAASDATSTETNTRFLPDATVSVFETYTTAVPTVSTGTVTSIVTITVPVAATTTVTSTLSTLTQTTTTVTSSIAAATSTSYLAIQNGPRKDRFMMRTGNVLRVDLAANQVGPGTGAQAVVAPAVGQDGELSIPGTNPPVKLFASADDDEKSALYLETEAEAAANGDKPALCSNTGGVLHCRVPSLELNQVFDCGSSGLLFSTGNPIPGSCVAVTFKVVTV